MRLGRGWNTNIRNFMEKLIWYSSEKVSRFIREKVREHDAVLNLQNVF